MKKKIVAVPLSILLVLSLFFASAGSSTYAQGPVDTPSPDEIPEGEADRRWDGDGNALAVRLMDDRLLESGMAAPRFSSLAAEPAPQAGYSGPFSAISVSSGYSFSCALTSTGAVKCWGDNSHGKLGDGTTTNRLTPVNVVGLSSGVIDISSAHKHTCALTSGGGVKCWGYNLHGELGDGTTEYRTTPVDVVGLSSGVVAVTAGGFHTCALMSGGAVKCWGANWHGEVGDGTTSHRLTPVNVDFMTWGAKAVSAGKFHTCAIDSSGAAKCWGYNKFGQLGDGTTEQKLQPVNVNGARRDIAGISLGALHSCLITTAGAVKCWGENSEGQLGDDTKLDRWVPVNVVGLQSGVTALNGGGYFTCARVGDSVLKCWGDNWAGQLGDGSNARRKTPVDVVGLAGAITGFDTGDSHTCAATGDGALQCWGSNAFGQLGDGTDALRLTPASVSGLPGGLSALATGGLHSCALTGDGSLYCWGNNKFGQLGDGTILDRLAPVQVVGLAGRATAVTAGDFHTCALMETGGVKCWGYNKYGQLGDGSQDHARMPVDVAGLASGVAKIAAGDNHTCAAGIDGRSWCWGDNFAGQVGDGTREEKPRPVRIKNLNGVVVVDIAAGWAHTCALISGGGAGNGGVKCWGSNAYGKLGDGTTTNRTTPVDVANLSSGVAAITVGSDHSCALTAGGKALCWGSNGYGQVGNGGPVQNQVPVEVVGLGSGVAALKAGGYHTCAASAAGGVRCWGDNGSGQLGDGTTFARGTPAPVAGLSGAVPYLAGGKYHTCAIVSSGGAQCWGTNGNGQVGDGTIPWRVTPGEVINLEQIQLAMNHAYGSPGSFFRIAATGFTAGAEITVSVNGHALEPLVTADNLGNATFLLSTNSAGVGQYGVTLTAGTQASTSFSLIAGAPLRPQEGSGPVLAVPAGIGFTHLIYLPAHGK